MCSVASFAAQLSISSKYSDTWEIRDWNSAKYTPSHAYHNSDVYNYHMWL